MATCPACGRQVDSRHRLYLGDVAVIEKSWPLVEWFFNECNPKELTRSELEDALSEVKFLYDSIVAWVHTPKWEWRSQPLGVGFPTPRKEDLNTALNFFLISLENMHKLDPSSALLWIDRLEPVMSRYLAELVEDVKSGRYRY